MSEQNTRDTQFASFAKLLWEEIEDKGEFNIDMASKDSDDIVRQIIARRAYDLVSHAINKIDRDEFETHMRREDTVATIPDMTEWPDKQ